MNKRIQSIFLTSVLICSMVIQGLPVSAQSRTYNDKSEITDTGVDLTTPDGLNIAKPSQDTTTTSSSYYITGTSDPEQSLTVNGVTVESRGRFGTFGMLVNLQVGENTFTVKNGSQTETVTITRKKAASGVAKTKTLTQAFPSFNDLAYAGEYTLSCVAPSDAEVTATVNGKKVNMKQVAATAESGVPARYKGVVTLKSPSGDSENIGSVTYTLTFNGETKTYTSEGEITVLHKNTSPTVEINQNATSVYEKDDPTSNFVSTLNKGAQDKLVDMSESLAKLSMGGWVKKEFLDLAEGNPSVINRVSGSEYTVSESGEYLTIRGTAPSAFKAYLNSEKLSIKFYNMKGLTSIPMNDSQLFERIDVTPGTSDVQLEFIRKSDDNLLGYDISYDEEGNITIFLNPMPKLAAGDKPLSGVTVVVDAGHGGMDPGALGLLDTVGPNENSFTMANAVAVQNRLESLGANVVMTVPKDISSNEKISLHERVQITRDNEADFFISLHCNSVVGTANDLKVQGSEVYYYENLSRQVAGDILTALTGYTGRSLRGNFYSNYFVTRNTICPAMLLEMGFVTNPVEYDEMRSKDSLFQTANAIADAILDYLE